MASGEARRIHLQTGQHVCIIGAHGRPLWSEVWENIPYIRRAPGENIVRLINGGGWRPYIAGKTDLKWTWKPYRPIPGDIRFTFDELRHVEQYTGMIMLEPNIKTNASPNKQWPWERWVELANRLPGMCIQVGKEGTRSLPGVPFVRTDTFRLAAAILLACREYIGHEGALHHAAAALGVPATVIFGGFISPENTGYDTHVNLFTGGVACGMRIPCKHCEDAMKRITVDMVLQS